ncbi:general secretion pathway protein GspK [Vibrio albus]|uniref:Type II secretion system protein K n=1 Tax=Vibrio albus TaxID=2200953 RepID=A0A2U3B875_9VIBR|nr:type II secretion system minor pseudopilin GspK [Vibrio albus]PWI32967.1 general secretion pathway protein GspK [Vibrio albus]
MTSNVFRSQKGAALIVVLMLLAVLVSIAATMSERLFVNFRRAEHQLSHQQAYWYSIGVEALARYGIEESYKDNDTINMSQPWALKEQVFPLDYGTATGHIRDMQSCFNINVLARVNAGSGSNRPYLVTVWMNLLQELGADNYQAEVIADSTWEFLDADSQVDSMAGVEDSTYESLQPAYLAPNGLVADASELRAVYQVDNKVMDQINHVVCALPYDDWRLNVNTLDENGAAILVALFSPHLSLGDARALVDNRPFDGWASVDDFLAEGAVAAIDSSVRNRAKGYLAVDSRYFELDAEVEVNESRVRTRSLLYSKNREDVIVIRRRFGGISERISDRSTE